MNAGPWPADVGLEVFDELDSTQTEARRRALVGAAGPVWIMARRQTDGHGRQGRAWASPTGNLMATVLMRPHVPIAKAPQVSFVAALAVADMLQHYVPQGTCTLKWPNDPLLGGAKAAGVLPDSMGRADGLLDWLIVGFGVNLATSPTDMPYPTQSIAGLTGTAPDPLEALTLLANFWAERFAAWQADGFESIRAAWLERAHGLGGPITVKLPNETFAATFDGLDEDGCLLARLADGTRRRIAAGEVFPVREAEADA